MPESTSKPTSEPDVPLDTRIRNAIAPIFDLDDDEMINDVLIIYTTVNSSIENLYYMSTSKIPGWKAHGMLKGCQDILDYD